MIFARTSGVTGGTTDYIIFKTGAPILLKTMSTIDLESTKCHRTFDPKLTDKSNIKSTHQKS